MRVLIEFLVILALAVSPIFGQIATGIHLADVRFEGDTRPDGVDLQKCANELKAYIFIGPEWTENVTPRVRALLESKGYLKAVINTSTEQLEDFQDTHQFRIRFNIHAGPRYGLVGISFRNNRAISDTKMLRGLFPINDGDFLEPSRIAQGLEHLRDAYEERGYINFTPVSSVTLDDAKGLGALEIDVDEGKQFFVSRIDVIGADVQVLDDLPLTPGDIYNRRIVEQFLQRQLPAVNVRDPKIQQLRLDERAGTVAVSFDFRNPED